jgi:hypothetical protein
MTETFTIRDMAYEREEWIVYGRIFGSLWVRRYCGRFMGRQFVAGEHPTRADVIDAFPLCIHLT